jgi:hypothetical protein
VPILEAARLEGKFKDFCSVASFIVRPEIRKLDSSFLLYFHDPSDTSGSSNLRLRGWLYLQALPYSIGIYFVRLRAPDRARLYLPYVTYNGYTYLPIPS